MLGDKNSKILGFYTKSRLRHYSYKFGIPISIGISIDKGFYIGRFSSIFVNHATIIGENVNTSQGVTIGRTNKGSSVIGNEIYIGSGAKIVGRVKLGSNAAIGANVVVIKDIPENSVIVGIPAKTISDKGAAGYINRKYVS